MEEEISQQMAILTGDDPRTAPDNFSSPKALTYHKYPVLRKKVPEITKISFPISGGMDILNR